MINLRTFLGSLIVIIGVMVITLSPTLVQAGIYSFKTTFVPVYVGSKQSNHIVVVNKSDGFNFNDVRTIGDNKYLLNRVIVRGFDPITGYLPDEEIREIIEPGKGESINITYTIPQAHASLVVVLVEFSHINDDAVSGGSLEIEGNDDEELPFIVTSLLVNRNDGTVLQVKGVTELLDDGSTPVE